MLPATATGKKDLVYTVDTNIKLLHHIEKLAEFALQSAVTMPDYLVFPLKNQS